MLPSFLSKPRQALLAALVVAGIGACETVPLDSGPGNRVIAPSGIIEGSVVYSGPHPCTVSGHVQGNLILLFFNNDQRPPPAGVASTAVNFGVVAGDVLFQNEPRTASSTAYCPLAHGVTDTVTASAPFTVSPFLAGSYIIEAFFDYTGDFLPTFKFRDLPERGDVGGGAIDTADALAHLGDVNYQPIFTPINVGVKAGSVDAGADASVSEGLVLPPDGFVASNVTVTVGSVLPLSRPYFYVDDVTGPASSPKTTTANASGNVGYVPAATMAQDIKILAAPLAAPASASAANVMAFQNSLTSMKFIAGLPSAELPAAINPSGPFHFQLSSSDPNSLFIWNSGTFIPESSLIPSLYPQIVFTKLEADPNHTLDPQSIVQQVPPTGPVIVMLGITLGPTVDVLDLVLTQFPPTPTPATASGHVTTLIRPVAICVDPTVPGQATLVTPYLQTQSADPDVTAPQPVFDPVSVIAALEPIFGTVTLVQGCLPPGRFAPNLVYPTGQAWTLPNESGSCSPLEGSLDLSTTPPSCAPAAGGAGRSVLYSQGTRSVLEVTASPGSAQCSQFPVPSACGG